MGATIFASRKFPFKLNPGIKLNMTAVVNSFGNHWLLILTFAVISNVVLKIIYAPLVASPLRQVPGPKLFALTKWRLALEDWRGTRTPAIHSLHQEYGTAVRLSPNELSFSSLTALRTIYGAGSGYERTSFYQMFNVYGRQNLFTFASPRAHGERKKLLNHAYSKSAILKGETSKMIEVKVKHFLELLEREKETAQEIFTSLHYFSLDSITGFLYGSDFGGTKALSGDEKSRSLLNDIMNPARRKLSWFAVHLTRYTAWLYTRKGMLEQLVTKLGLLPMHKPSTYTGIRAHALNAWTSFEAAPIDVKTVDANTTIMGRLWKHEQSEKPPLIDGLDIASEAADHLLAGIDTTSDTLMFLIWALSLPEHKTYQQKLIEELDGIESGFWNTDDILSATAADQLPYLDALIKETLRLYAPLPASEPRSLPVESTIDGYLVPAGTTVSMSPYTLHRNASVFPEPLKFKPERWLGEYGDLVEMKKWFWAFSSGGRMCIGIQ